MKKILLTYFALLICTFIKAQSDADYLYINPTGNSKGVMYKSPDGSGKYTVLPKNTLYSISKLHGMSVEELSDLNGISGTTILIGQKLKVKTTSETAKGLNIGSTASVSGVNETLKTNHLEIKETGELEIAASHPAMLRAEKLKSESVDLEQAKGTYIKRDSEVWYIPNDEENFHTIATKFDMSFDSLRDLNQMNDYLYRKGIVLIVVPGRFFGLKTYPENMPMPKETKAEEVQAEEASLED